MVPLIGSLIVSLTITFVNLYNNHKRASHPASATASQQTIKNAVANSEEYQELKARMP